MSPGRPQHGVVPVYAGSASAAFVYVCERCGQPLAGAYDLCTSPLHVGCDQLGIGHAVSSTELARLAGAGLGALGGSR